MYRDMVTVYLMMTCYVLHLDSMVTSNRVTWHFGVTNYTLYLDMVTSYV